jgi:hypothetical protein
MNGILVGCSLSFPRLAAAGDSESYSGKRSISPPAAAAVAAAAAAACGDQAVVTTYQSKLWLWLGR